MANTSSTPHSPESSPAPETFTAELRESSDPQSKPEELHRQHQADEADELSDDALENVAGGAGSLRDIIIKGSHLDKRRAIRESI